MPYKNLLLIIFLFFVYSNTFATVFVVTSNADSGPGTLRDALTQAAANGTTDKDYINFNIADTSQAGRTITLQNRLPDISSNLIIDGTTQPGGFFGVSHTKIRIINHYSYPQNTSTFYSNGADLIEIYGLWLTADNAGTIYGGYAVHFRNFGNIKIGALAKGNLLQSGIIELDTGKAVTFQNNICFSDTSGEKPAVGSMSIISCDTITIGGSTNTGNMIAGLLNVFFSNTVANKLELSYNIMGADITGTKAPYGFNLIDETRVSIQGPYLSTGQPAYVPVSGVIKNNIIADVYGYDLLYIGVLGGKFVIQGNAFNTDFTGTLNFNAYSQSIAAGAIIYGGNGDILIGGDDPAQKNIIAYCETGIQYAAMRKSTISKNSIFCISDELTAIGAVGSEKPPIVKINSVSNNSILGTATPGSTVELFNADCSCNMPGPKYYLSTVNADANGNWSYTGAINGYIMASATLDSLTGYFTGLNINDSTVVITNSTCNAKGSISGIKTQFTSGIQWYNSQNQLVGTNIDLVNVDPGVYTLKIGFGSSCQLSKSYTIKDNSINVDVSKIQYNSPSCTKQGSITGISTYSSGNEVINTKWINQSGQTMCNCLDLNNVIQGVYTFVVSHNDGSCYQTYGPYTLTNTTGPNIDQSNTVITSSNCGSSTGSITGINATGSGTLTYSWKNAQQQIVSTTKDLLNQPAGSYTLQVTDQGSCGPVYSSTITIPEANGITIDTTAKAQTVAICGQDTGGSITNIKVTGATGYQWVDASGNTVSTQPDLTNVAAGRYYLIASNTFCSKQTPFFTVAQQTNTTNYGGTTKVLTNATCGLNNGSIQLIFEHPNPAPAIYRWVNSSGQTVGGNSTTLSNIDAGTYQFYATDSNGCEKYIISYSIGRTPGLTVNSNNVQINNDNCQTGTGSIKGIGATGAAPLSFTWTDASGQTIANTIDLLNVKAGTYSIKITDGSGCEQDLTYTVQDISSTVPAPSVTNLQLCAAGEALLSVNNPSSAYSFRLYDSPTSAAPLDDQASGKFKIAVSANRSYYISQYTGACESSRAEVDVSVGLTKLSIANTFTPNNDGTNDTWAIHGLENYPDGIVQIYNRFGQKVFQSKGYMQPFDGRMNGQDLPSGTYYYIINLNTKCDVISGSLTILR